MTEQEWLEIFGENLRDLLGDRGYSQKDLADSTGVSQSSINYYLNKKKMPGIRAIVNIAYELDCPVSELIDFGDKIEG